jgi:hypothetical protein
MFQVLTRRLALLESPYTTHFWTGVVGFTLLSLLVMVSNIDVAAVWHAATAKHLAVLLAIGLLADSVTRARRARNRHPLRGQPALPAV